MLSPYRNQAPPYSLPSNIIYFHDWRHVQYGRVGWRDDEGNHQPLFTTDYLPQMHYEPTLLPTGVRLQAQAAQKSGPVLTPGQLDEQFISSATVLRDQSRYRLYVDCTPAEHIGTEQFKPGSFNYVRTAESDDGQEWKFPILRLIERHGSKDNNVVYGGPDKTPVSGYHGGSVFRDPAAPPEARYKMIYQGHLSEEMKAQYQRERPEDIDPFNLDRPAWAGLFGAISPDGLHWSALPEPLVAQISDTQNICEYDPVLKKYVAYCRNWFFHRRTIGRIIADEFRRFPLSQDVLWPDPSMDPDELWYASGKTKMPGTVDYHLMFPMRWSIRDDSFDFHLATSPDNLLWHRVPGGPVCRPGAPGDWDGGIVQPGSGLVELPDQRMGVPLCATHVPHKHPRRPPFGAIGWAWWTTGRLVALEAPVEGAFTLQPLKVEQRRAYVNCKTALAGFIQVQVLDPDNNPLPGRSFADCDWIDGDHLERELTWNGEADLGHDGEAPLTLSFKMRCAQLFSIAFK